MSFLCWGPQSWVQHCRWRLTRAEQRNRIPSFPCYPHCFGCSPGYNWFSGMQVHFVGSQPASQPPQILLLRAGLSLFIPSLSWYQGLSQPRCSTLHLVLLNLMRFPLIYLSTLSRFFIMASQNAGYEPNKWISHTSAVSFLVDDLLNISLISVFRTKSSLPSAVWGIQWWSVPRSCVTNICIRKKWLLVEECFV